MSGKGQSFSRYFTIYDSVVRYYQKQNVPEIIEINERNLWQDLHLSSLKYSRIAVR